MYLFARFAGSLLLALMLEQTAAATSIPRLSFEELTDRAELIVTARVVRSWPAWDSSHQNIWTHYQLAVTGMQKGAAASTIEIAEPGGSMDGIGMSVAGAVAYGPGETVALFAERMPNGYIRTAGWGQGKFSIDKSGTLHSLSGLLEGTPVEELNARVAARLRATRQKNTSGGGRQQ